MAFGVFARCFDKNEASEGRVFTTFLTTVSLFLRSGELQSRRKNQARRRIISKIEANSRTEEEIGSSTLQHSVIKTRTEECKTVYSDCNKRARRRRKRREAEKKIAGILRERTVTN